MPAPVNHRLCPLCKTERTGGCRCSGPHSYDDLKKGHGSECKNGHRWSYGLDGKAVTFDAGKSSVTPTIRHRWSPPEGNTLSEGKVSNPKIVRLKKSKQLKMPDKETLKMLVEFLSFASKKLELGQEPVVITLLHAAPEKPITTGAFSPDTKEIDCIVENRHFIDYARTIAHEMVHLRQCVDGRTEGKIQEIGGEIEDEANSVAGQIMKGYIKTVLTPEQRKHLGLGNYA